MNLFWTKISESSPQAASLRLKLLAIHAALFTVLSVLVLFVVYRPTAERHGSVTQTNVAAVYAASRPVGLSNPRNTCYANSILQMMYRMPTVWTILKAVQRRKGSIADAPNIKLCSNLKQLFAGMESASKSFINPKPWPFLPPGFTESKQEDAEEFFATWLNVLENAAKALGFNHASITKSLYISVVRYRQPTIPAVATDSLVEQAGEDLWKAIKVIIPPDYTTQKCLPFIQLLSEEPFGREVIGDYWYWYGIESLPDIVPISVLRYHYSAAKESTTKLKTALDIPDFLDLSAFCLDPSVPATYRLKMFVQHRGATTKSGHYVSYARDGEQWREFNDHVVTNISIHKAFKQAATSTLLFYAKEHKQ